MKKCLASDARRDMEAIVDANVAEMALDLGVQTFQSRGAKRRAR